MPKTSKAVKGAPAKKERKPKKIGVTVYLFPEEHATITRASNREHRSITSYIATKIVPQAERDLAGAK